MSSSFLFSSSMLLVIAFAAAAAASGGGSGHPEEQTPATPNVIHPASAKTVTIISNPDVAEAFKKGVPMLETGEYKINAGRRDTAGPVEVHLRDSDIFYILEGSAVFITGGTVQEGKTTAPNEVRGTSISGGETHKLSKGDVVVIPRGVPHWFKEVSQGPVLYFVVKTTAAEGAK
jgi:mannose-6-phosphate isomerase-like protein (cupin superfamily)